MRLPLKYIKEDDVCAEIGVWHGDFSKQILEIGKPSELHLIDPWETQDFRDRWYSVNQKTMDKIFNKVINTFSSESKVVIHRNYSRKVDFSENYFDWIYIDANHSYKEVLKDLHYYLPLVKSGGFICGDDYGWKDKYCSDGPKRAVDEFTEECSLEVKISGTQYIISI
jgi:cephalosporin hydroxylase